MPLTIRKQHRILTVSVAVSFFLTHGYRFFHPLLSGDSLLMVYQNDAAWQIALGRFVQPVLVFLRGGITAPFFISILALVFVTLAACLTAEVLQITGTVPLILTGAVMSCNVTLITAGANFLPWFDFYALALLCAVAGVWFLGQKKLTFKICGILCLTLTLGIYQAYICVAVGLVMLKMLFDLPDGTVLKPVEGTSAWIKRLVSYVIPFALSAVLYYAIWKGFQSALGIWTADTYNGLASVGDYTDVSVASSLAMTYQNVWLFFVHPVQFVTMTFREQNLSVLWTYLLVVCNAFLCVYGLYRLVRLNLAKQTSLLSRVLQAGIVVLFPFGINLVCFVSKGMEHTLMMYAFQLVYLFVICAHDRTVSLKGSAGADASFASRWRFLLPLALPFCLILWSLTVYANQVYLKKELQERAAQSMMTRIMMTVEETEGYVAGETPVAFSGSFEINLHIAPLDAVEELLPWQTGQSAFVYAGTADAYLRFFENTDVVLTRIDADDEAVRALPLWPEQGSVSFVGDVLVIKLSD